MAAWTLFPGVKKEQIGKPTKALAQGEETLKLAGREIKTFWYDTKDRGDPPVHTRGQHIVQVGMDGVDRHIAFNGRDHGPFHVIATGDLFQAAENDGVMRHDQVASPGPGFFDYLLGAVQAADHPGAFPVGVPGQQTGVVVSFLVGRRRIVFERLYYFLYFHRG